VWDIKRFFAGVDPSDILNERRGGGSVKKLNRLQARVDEASDTHCAYIVQIETDCFPHPSCFRARPRLLGAILEWDVD
jgi:hypothetical protein